MDGVSININLSNVCLQMASQTKQSVHFSYINDLTPYLKFWTTKLISAVRVGMPYLVAQTKKIQKIIFADEMVNTFPNLSKLTEPKSKLLSTYVFQFQHRVLEYLEYYLTEWSTN